MLFALRRGDQHPQPPLAHYPGERLDDREAVHVGHRQVEDQQVDPHVGVQRHDLGAGGEHVDVLVAVCDEKALDRATAVGQSVGDDYVGVLENLVAHRMVARLVAKGWRTAGTAADHAPIRSATRVSTVGASGRLQRSGEPDVIARPFRPLRTPTRGSVRLSRMGRVRGPLPHGPVQVGRRDGGQDGVPGSVATRRHERP
jgi:hypothetical protein